MRLILILLAIANYRWSRAEMERSECLYRLGDEAWLRSEARKALADAQARRSRLLA